MTLPYPGMFICHAPTHPTQVHDEKNSKAKRNWCPVGVLTSTCQEDEEERKEKGTDLYSTSQSGISGPGEPESEETTYEPVKP